VVALAAGTWVAAPATAPAAAGARLAPAPSARRRLRVAG
jgi:hypothetical protein